MFARRISALALFVSLAAPVPAVSDDADVARLIRQLGSTFFSEREVASQKLEALGEAVRIVLREATADADPEVRRRAARILRTFDDKLCLLRYDGHTGAVFGVTFAPDGRRVLSACDDNTVRVVDVATGKLIHTLKHPAALTVAVAPDGKTAISTGLGNGYTLRHWDLGTGRELKSFAVAAKGAYRAAFSPDGKRVLFGGYDDESIHWLDLESGLVAHTFRGHTGRVYGLALSADGKTTLSTGHDRTIRLWDNATGEELKRFTGHSGYVWAVALSPDGTRAVSGGNKHVIRLWDVKTGKELRQVAPHAFCIHSLAFSPDGKRVASANFNDCTVSLWDPETGTEIRRYTGHTDEVHDVAFSANGTSLVSGSRDKTVRIWRVVK